MKRLTVEKLSLKGLSEFRTGVGRNRKLANNKQEIMLSNYDALNNKLKARNPKNSHIHSFVFLYHQQRIFSRNLSNKEKVDNGGSLKLTYCGC